MGCENRQGYDQWQNFGNIPLHGPGSDIYERNRSLLDTGDKLRGVPYLIDDRKRRMDRMFGELGFLGFSPMRLIAEYFVRQDGGDSEVCLEIGHPAVGVTFIHKIRTMVSNARELDEEIFGGMDTAEYKNNHFDPRITPIGRFLRERNLDEIAQFDDIRAGRMSMVGPRPPSPQDIRKLLLNRDNSPYKEYLEIMGRIYRVGLQEERIILYGLTGEYGINGRQKLEDFEDRFWLEKLYLEEASLRGDIKIVLRTILIFLSKSGV